MKTHHWSRESIKLAGRTTLPALALLVMLPGAAALAQTTYTLTVIPLPPKLGLHGQANSINANGDIAGQDVFDSTGQEGALVQAGKGETELTANPGTQSENPPISGAQGNGINNSDQVVGWAWMGNPNFSGDPQHVAVLWQSGQTVGANIDNNFAHFPFCEDVEAQAINNVGQIVGFAGTCKAVVNNNSSIAWIFQNGKFTNLPTLGGPDAAAFGINDNGQVVGDSDLDATNGTTHAFLWQSGKGIVDLGTLPGGLFAEAVAINKNGAAVGVSTLNGGTFDTGDRHAALFQNGTVTDLTPNLPSGFDAFANSINSGGQIVGGQLGHAFIWVNGVGTDLNTLIPANSGFTLVAGNAINDKGQIAASGNASGASRQEQMFLLTPNN
jgi:probable HAF family extracellular repeat protein